MYHMLSRIMHSVHDGEVSPVFFLSMGMHWHPRGGGEVPCDDDAGPQISLPSLRPATLRKSRHARLSLSLSLAGFSRALASYDRSAIAWHC